MLLQLSYHPAAVVVDQFDQEREDQISCPAADLPGRTDMAGAI
jgi:hypothetical protein